MKIEFLYKKKKFPWAQTKTMNRINDEQKNKLKIERKQITI